MLPQDTGGQAVRLVLAGREVNVRSGARPQPGPVVLRYGGSSVIQQRDDGGISYVVADNTVRAGLASPAFRGFKATAGSSAKPISPRMPTSGVQCLAAFSY